MTLLEAFQDAIDWLMSGQPYVVCEADNARLKKIISALRTPEALELRRRQQEELFAATAASLDNMSAFLKEAIADAKARDDRRQSSFAAHSSSSWKFTYKKDKT